MLKVNVITTGGTIEKVYSEQTSTVENLDNQIDRYLARLRLPACDVRVVPLMNKDSLEMTDADRSAILGLIEPILSEPSAVVITHGTDTMVQTGLYLKQALPELKVPIVLTGAMTPLRFEGSDGLQNLTESFFAVRILGPGIYIVMHNQVFPIDRVRKDRETSRFVWTD
ncbi:MAG TPA: asparaginase [Pyrinomonadaceae bacterium]|nr:asparaginase [Pyrinomonadaceae bacterium]